jgi:hypothetical protein
MQNSGDDAGIVNGENKIDMNSMSDKKGNFVL